MEHKTLNPIELAVFSSRLSAICEEMGIALQKTSFSPNIKDRLITPAHFLMSRVKLWLKPRISQYILAVWHTL